ncbi:aminoglycoside phosphotransferase family protein [Phytoactinopolyspora endophytica]|uniref:aminoglycoside phosphotransferase family protein n=1 Tax=Phytoactinopolyspora endophytica TaxID=1642495 RepID=UPI00101BAA60|nr:aminoglycoside phosphotransferase family protein [Phytoactinopolyspora endophytica]
MHANELTVSVETVRELVDEQFPEWRGLSIKQVASRGTVNALFRLSDRLVARLPLVPGDVGQMRQRIESEARAARELLGRSRFPTPAPVGIGEPGDGYPLPWSVQTWLPGTVATDADPGESVDFGHDLAEFIQGVRAIDTHGRTHAGHGRGGDLRAHDAWVETCFQRSEQLLEVPRLRRLWSVLRELPRHAPDVMTHGDLNPGNVLVSDNRLAGIIDVGSLGPADPALDLVGAWHLLEAGPRQVLRDDLECDDLEWARGKAWAFEQALGVVWYYVDSNPTMSLMGWRTLERLMAEPAPN